MFRKGLITAVLASLTFAVSIQNNENEDQVMALSGDLNLPVSFHVGQVSLKAHHDDENCPYAVLV
jgi:hypothetical protein